MGYNKLIINGGQICDYLYIQNTALAKDKFSKVNSEPKEWTKDTVMLSKFDNDLSAGNSAIKDKLNGYELRRRGAPSGYTQKIASINSGVADYIIDYSAANNTKYTYYLYPAIDESDDSKMLAAPLTSDEVLGDWEYWSLLVADETDEENVYYLNKMFKFELNLNIDEMNNNAVVSVTQNFTRYPTVQYGTSNYWSGKLSSLCGYINCSNTEYIQTPNIIRELKELTSDTRKKFLKDISGNLWEVKITAPISITTQNDTLQDVQSVSLSWTETADASNVSIINNPNEKTVSWLLTETGIPKPYIQYVWDNDGIWDNDKIWTANNDILGTDISNMGRDITEEQTEVVI